MFFYQNGYKFRENSVFVVSELVVGSGEQVIYDMVWTRNKEEKNVTYTLDTGFDSKQFS